jgi:DNA polymerase I-like protein with 3'-5' exonuclease and polymerase domains
MIKYLATEKEWGKLLDYILRSRGPTGLDSEFSGVDFKSGQSCPDKARIHVWSLAVADGGYSPRGFDTAVGAVLPAEAIPFFRGYFEDAGIVKYAHNSPVDVHAFYNSGVDVLGVVNTLSLARWVYPGRLTQSLDSLSRDYLGTGKIISFKELVTIPAYVTKMVEVKDCDCGAARCRKRKGHTKTIRLEAIEVEKGTAQIPLEDIIPGHFRWPILVEYAGQDAVMAFCLGDYLNRVAEKKEIYIPWLK